MEKCVATTPGRSFSWSMKARMLSERGTPLPLCHSRRRFPCKVQSSALAYQLPSCLFVSLLWSCAPNCGEPGKGQFGCILPTEPKWAPSHERSRFSRKLGQFSDFHAIGSSRVNSHWFPFRRVLLLNAEGGANTKSQAAPTTQCFPFYQCNSLRQSCDASSDEFHLTPDQTGDNFLISLSLSSPTCFYHL